MIYFATNTIFFAEYSLKRRKEKLLSLLRMLGIFILTGFF